MALLAQDAGHSEVALETRAGIASRPVAFALLAGVPVLVAAWMLISPGRVLSHEMTWDFLFILEGAWHLHFGHVAHVDFHDPVGQLNFLLTALGFRLVGPTPLAFVVGSLLLELATFAAATLAAWRRLPLLPAAIFVVFASLLVVMPANVGDPPSAYSFAMSYNRYGWSALSILVLILFVPPRPDSRAWPGGDALDTAVAALLILALFYVKITYFAAALAALWLALLFYPHVRERWPAWLLAGGLIVVNALAPYNRPYLLDIWDAAQAGQARGGLGVHLNTFFTAAEGYAAYAAGLAVAAWLWWDGRAPLRLPIAIAFLLFMGMFLLTQNYQAQGVPLGVMIAFLLYDQFSRRPSEERLDRGTPALMALMVFPLASIGASSLSLASYRLNASHDERLLIVNHTHLKGLAVPVEPPGLLAAFANGTGDYTLLNRARILRPRHELTPSEYVETLLEAASLFDDGRRRGGIVVFDQVNPLPFMFGVAPPRGGSLWSGWGVPVRPAAEVFADASYVLIPKFSTYSPWTRDAVRIYGAYLSEHFPHREETQSWIMLSRDGEMPAQTFQQPLAQGDDD
jgi:hypothetical protein